MSKTSDVSRVLTCLRACNEAVTWAGAFPSLAERARLGRALRRAEHISANIAAHPAALAACVDGMERDALEPNE